MKKIKTKGVWVHPLKRFYKFLNYCEEHNLPKTILIIGSADGNLAIAAAKRGFKVTAIEMNESLVYGGEPVLIDGKLVENKGMLKRIELEGDIDGLIKYYVGDYMTIDTHEKYSLIFTSNSIHYPENLKYEAKNLVGKMVDMLDKNGLLLLEYIHESEESKKYQGHYLNKKQMKDILDARGDNKILSNIVKVYYENGNIVDTNPHKITIARVYVQKLPSFVENEESAKYYDTLPRFNEDVYNYLEKMGLKNKIIADVGSGTGRIAIDLLERGNKVYAIDPDKNMRCICDKKCKKYKDKYIPVIGTDANMNIANNSVDYIVVSQSFHRFNPSMFKKECKRVLKQNGKVLIIWYRIDFKNKIYSQMLSNVKKCYKKYKTRYEVSDEIEGANLEEKENIKSASDFYENRYDMNEVMSTVKLGVNEFKNLGLSMELFPIAHSLTTVTKIINSKEFDKEKYISNLEKIFEENKKDNKIELPFRVQIISNKGEL